MHLVGAGKREKFNTHMVGKILAKTDAEQKAEDEKDMLMDHDKEFDKALEGLDEEHDLLDEAFGRSSIDHDTWDHQAGQPEDDWFPNHESFSY